jgi:hypothetical protein
LKVTANDSATAVSRIQNPAKKFIESLNAAIRHSVKTANIADQMPHFNSG